MEAHYEAGDRFNDEADADLRELGPSPDADDVQELIDEWKHNRDLSDSEVPEEFVWALHAAQTLYRRGFLCCTFGHRLLSPLRMGRRGRAVPLPCRQPRLYSAAMTSRMAEMHSMTLGSGSSASPSYSSDM